MPNISDSLMLTKFLASLRHCESELKRMSDWEQKFVKDLREKFEERETMIDMGVTPWNPSANQWNTLMLLSKEYE